MVMKFRATNQNKHIRTLKKAEGYPRYTLSKATVNGPCVEHMIIPSYPMGPIISLKFTISVVLHHSGRNHRKNMEPQRSTSQEHLGWPQGHQLGAGHRPVHGQGAANGAAIGAETLGARKPGIATAATCLKNHV